MAVFKCKMCGGGLNITEGMTVCECEYCGSVQTVPQLDDEKKINLFSRANRLRSAGEFDKASGVYETLVSDYPEEAEAYWGLLLCKFGIEYVDDPGTGKKVPTCHRSSFDSIMEDEDFEMVMECSDPASRAVYREEAKAIEALRIAINEVSSKEDPYDIFICYKETDDSGNRTIDSVIAQDVYQALIEKGYKVFFSRITLEDKLGKEYEPYIFAALNSAKIMLAFGTDYEYYNAVWVKNEWSRFLSLIEKGANKTLIPCFKGIYAYDMPKEFARLQAQDMGKVGAMQDLLRGIEKILGTKNRNTVTPPVPSALKEGDLTKMGLLRRTFMFIEEGDWRNADRYAEKILDIDPENGEAYLAKAMADLRIPNLVTLTNIDYFENNPNTQRALRYGSDALRNDIMGFIESHKSAERMRLKAEEERKKKEEKAAQEAAEKVISAFQSQTRSFEHQLTAAKKNVSDLERICAGYDQTASQMRRLSMEKAETERKLNDLRAQHDSLGVFAGKEKKRLENEILNASQALKQLDEQLAYAGALLGGFPTETEAQTALSSAKEELSRIETKIEADKKEGAGVLTFGQAMQVLLSNPRVIQIISEKNLKQVSTYKGYVKITFGRYPKTSNGEIDDIEWLVLKQEGKKVLLISNDALDCQKYNENNTDVTWENCSLRKWLNETFITSAFSAEEINMISSTLVVADKTRAYTTAAVKDTVDKIFLLSSTEANLYLNAGNARVCQASEYCRAKGGYGSSRWWLRSPGAYVSEDGTVNFGGRSVFVSNNAVRPAMWIDLEA